MTKLELLKMLEERAREFRLDRDTYKRNSHLHEITRRPSQKVIDAVLEEFINYVGMIQGVDYGLKTKDFLT